MISNQIDKLMQESQELYDILDANDANHYKAIYDHKAKRMSEKLQSKMESIVSSVEGFISLQKLSKEGTKS